MVKKQCKESRSPRRGIRVTRWQGCIVSALMDLYKDVNTGLKDLFATRYRITLLRYPEDAVLKWWVFSNAGVLKGPIASAQFTCFGDWKMQLNKGMKREDMTRKELQAFTKALNAVLPYCGNGTTKLRPSTVLKALV